jgi:hypothetical protein
LGSRPYPMAGCKCRILSQSLPFSLPRPGLTLEKYLHTGRPLIARRPRRPESVFRSRVTRLRLAAPTCAIMPTDQQGPR